MKKRTDYSISEDKKMFGRIYKVSGPCKLFFARLFKPQTSGRRREHGRSKDVRAGKYKYFKSFNMALGQSRVGQTRGRDH